MPALLYQVMFPRVTSGNRVTSVMCKLLRWLWKGDSSLWVMPVPSPSSSTPLGKRLKELHLREDQPQPLLQVILECLQRVIDLLCKHATNQVKADVVNILSEEQLFETLAGEDVHVCAHTHTSVQVLVQCSRTLRT